MHTPGDPALTEAQHRRLHLTAFWVAVAAVLGAIVAFGSFILYGFFRFPALEKVLEEHFAALMGLPLAAAAAFVLVVFCARLKAR